LRHLRSLGLWLSERPRKADRVNHAKDEFSSREWTSETWLKHLPHFPLFLLFGFSRRSDRPRQVSLPRWLEHGRAWDRHSGWHRFCESSVGQQKAIPFMLQWTWDVFQEWLNEQTSAHLLLWKANDKRARKSCDVIHSCLYHSIINFVQELGKLVRPDGVTSLLNWERWSFFAEMIIPAVAEKWWFLEKEAIDSEVNEYSEINDSRTIWYHHKAQKKSSG
jgi:hypothetical protein